MQDTADDTKAAGQPDNSSDDSAVQQTLAAAVEQPDPQQPAGGSQDDSKPQQRVQQSSGSSDPWADPEAARKEIEKLRRESAGWRTKYRDAEPQLSEYQKWVDSQKSEQQKLQEAKETAERELTGLRSANARLMAAATHNLPPDLIDLLGDGSADDIDARAKLLAEKLAAAAPAAAPAAEPAKPASAGRRPVEALTPGAKPASEEPDDPNAWLRRMAGRAP